MAGEYFGIPPRMEDLPTGCLCECFLELKQEAEQAFQWECYENAVSYYLSALNFHAEMSSRGEPPVNLDRDIEKKLRLGLAQSYLRTNKIAYCSDAIYQCKKALSLAKGEFDWKIWMVLARALMFDGKFGEALEAAKNTLSRLPSHETSTADGMKKQIRKLERWTKEEEREWLEGTLADIGQTVKSKQKSPEPNNNATSGSKAKSPSSKAMHKPRVKNKKKDEKGQNETITEHKSGSEDANSSQDDIGADEYLMTFLKPSARKHIKQTDNITSKPNDGNAIQVDTRCRGSAKPEETNDTSYPTHMHPPIESSEYVSTVGNPSTTNNNNSLSSQEQLPLHAHSGLNSSVKVGGSVPSTTTIVPALSTGSQAAPFINAGSEPISASKRYVAVEPSGTVPISCSTTGITIQERIRDEFKRLQWLHEYNFTMACPCCFVKTDEGIHSYQYNDNIEHHCLMSYLLVSKIDNGSGNEWQKIRKCKNPYYLGTYKECHHFKNGVVCYVGEDNCTFAHGEDELKFWRLEQGGLFNHYEFVKRYRQLASESSTLHGSTTARSGYDAPLKTNHRNIDVNPDNRLTQPRDCLLLSLYTIVLACKRCFIKHGEGSMGYTYDPTLQHECMKTFLLVRSVEDKSKQAWVKIRKRKNPSFRGVYQLCTYFANGITCRHGSDEVCDFAHSEHEIRFWNAERDGEFNYDYLISQPRKTCSDNAHDSDSCIGDIAVEGDSYALETTIIQPDASGGPALTNETTDSFLTKEYTLVMACFECFKKNGEGRQAYRFHELLDHICSRIFLLARHIDDTSVTAWVKIRKCKKPHHKGLYKLCEQFAGGIRCQRGTDEWCDFAHSEHEIKFWNAERDGSFSYDTTVKQMSTDFPLRHKYNYRLACRVCFSNTIAGKGSHNPDVHSAEECDENVLILKPIGNEGNQWVRIRENLETRCFADGWKLCRHKDDPKHYIAYGDTCRYAHSVEEQELWNCEMRTKFRVFDFVLAKRRAGRGLMSSVEAIHEKYGGQLKYLCFPCYEQGTISEQKSNKCSSGQHNWGGSKKLFHEVHVGTNTFLTPIYPTPAIRIFALCPSLAYCKNKINCGHAHSIVERDIWMVEQEMRISRDEMVKKSTDFVNSHSNRKSKTLGISPTTVALKPEEISCPYTMGYVCGTCWKNGVKKFESRFKGKCEGKQAHEWSRSKVCLEFTTSKVIRQPRHTKIIADFKMCQHETVGKKKGGSCQMGDSCYFAHSEIERDVWTWMAKHNVKAVDDLVRASEIKRQEHKAYVKPVKTVLHRREVIQTPDIPPRPYSFYCSYCNTTCNSSTQLDNHNASAKHRMNVQSDSELPWDYRNPPWSHISELALCKLHARNQSCQYSFVTEKEFNYCPHAHSTEELDEWRKRLEWQQLKRDASVKKQALSYMDKLLETYNTCPTKDQVLKETVEGVDIECREEMTVYLPKKTDNTSWTFALKVNNKDLTLVKVSLLHHKDRLHFNLVGGNVENRCQIDDGHLFQNGELSYTVKVAFEAALFGSFEQWVCFDFGGAMPKLVRKLYVDVCSEADVKRLKEAREEHQFLKWTKNNRTIVKFNELETDELKLLAAYEEPETSSEVVGHSTLRTIIDRMNYKRSMHRLLNMEEMARKKLIASYNLEADVTPMQHISDPSFGLLVAQDGQLFVRVPLNAELSEDTLAGILVLRSVTRALISLKDSETKTVYEALVLKEKGHGMDFDGLDRESIVLRLSAQCCKELNLTVDHQVTVEIQFQMNRMMFCCMHYAVDQFNRVPIIFPNLSNIKIDRRGIQIGGNASLNEHQRDIARYVLASNHRDTPPLIAYGPYGTGKTETLWQTAKLLFEKRPSSKLLFCTHSNSAADLFIDRCLSKWNGNPEAMGISMLRVHSKDTQLNRIPMAVRPFCLIDGRSRSSREPTKKEVLDKQATIVTLTTSLVLTQLQLQGEFTHIFIDEAAQALECEAIMPLALATKETCVVIVGDHKQMSPKVYSSVARDNFFHQSLLERLVHHYTAQESLFAVADLRPVKVMLCQNYRSHRTILGFLSSIFYGGEHVLKACSEEVDCKSVKPMSFYAAQGKEIQYETSTSYCNPAETTEVAVRVKSLFMNWPNEWGERDPKQIGVVSPYTDQVKMIRSALRGTHPALKDVTVESIYNVQGKEFQALFLSTVRTTEEVTNNGEQGFLSDEKMLNTALTRARGMIAVVGDPVALCSVGSCSKIWQTYIKECENAGSLFPASLSVEEIRLKIDQIVTKPTRLHGTPNVDLTSTERSDTAPHILQRMQSWDVNYRVEPDSIIRQLAFASRKHDHVHSNSTDDLPVDGDRVHIEEEGGFAVISYRRLIDEETKTVTGEVEGENPIENVRLPDPQGEIFKKCILQINSASHIFAHVLEPGSDKIRKIKIPSWRKCGKAFSGDDVLVEVDGEIDDVVCGHVVDILRNNTNPTERLYVCKANTQNIGMMIPIDGSVSWIRTIKERNPSNKSNKRDISVYTLDEAGNTLFERFEKVNLLNDEEKLFVVQYLKWRADCTYPLGIVIGTLQPDDTVERGMEILDIEHNIKKFFKRNAEAEAGEIVIPESALANRSDCRGDLTFTIDPEHSKDLDDALSIQRQSDGCFLVGVHIADVSCFVAPGTCIDEEARLRGVTYYPDGRDPIPMLPDNLSTDLCSLLPGRDRLVLSIYFIFNEAGTHIQTEHIERSVINSKYRLSYNVTEDIIEYGNTTDEELKQSINDLSFLAQRLCNTRLGDASQQRQSDETTKENPRAHTLVEEMMILANKEVANLLLKHFPESTPLRRQLEAGYEELLQWKQNNIDAMDNSLAFSKHGREDAISNSNDTKETRPESAKTFDVLKSAWVAAGQAMSAGDFGKFKKLLLDVDNEPQVLVALKRYHDFQQKSSYVCSGETSEHGHSSLELNAYTHFTSPIRRYLDVIVHRMVVAIIEDKKSPPYNQQEVAQICRDCTLASTKANKYERETFALNLAHDLKSKPLVTFPVISDVDDRRFVLQLRQQKVNQVVKTQVKFAHLNPSCQPEFDENNQHVSLHWQLRVFDNETNSVSNSRNNIDGLTSGNSVQLDQDAFVEKIPVQVWHPMLQALKENNIKTCEKLYEAASKEMSRQPRTNAVDYPGKGDKDLCSFSQTYHPCMVVKVQLASEMRTGMLSPCIQLVSITPTLDTCIEHRVKPVICFTSPIASSASRKNYQTTEEYTNAWMPPLCMESAVCSVEDTKSVVLRSMTIEWEHQDGTHTGQFSIEKEVCDARELDFSIGDFLCLRYPGMTVKHQASEENESVCWVAHALTTGVSRDKRDGMVNVELRLHNSAVIIPQQLYQSPSETVRCTIEWIPKALPDRRKEHAVTSVRCASELAQAIALGSKPPDMASPTGHKLMAIQVPLPQPNTIQEKALLQALNNSFSLIQGPPGTGKTITGVRLACSFVQRNRSTGNKLQVMYCGPSNKAVDVVTGYFQKLQSASPKIVRVYSKMVEDHDYPIPNLFGPTKQSSRAEKDAKDAKKHKDVALHHLIRQPGNEFANTIKEYDDLLRKFIVQQRGNVDLIPESERAKVTQSTIKTYKNLITKAARTILGQAEIVLCTCTRSSAKKLDQPYGQLIIDECGQCTEPESLIPIVAHSKVNQIVLIGDHKQLRPFVKCDQAEELGLKVGLFERYADITKLVMLTTQYRMHPAIASFPSNQFYNGRLVVGNDNQNQSSKLRIWPGGQTKPIAFCHIVGQEETLTVSTAEGSENSRSNKDEAMHAIRIAEGLLQKDRGASLVILTQYRAQEAELTKRLERRKKLTSVAISTVVASQGSEWDYAILSTVRSLPRDHIETCPTAGWTKTHLGFITDSHQVNVAITRARKGLVIIGNKELLECDHVWKKLIAHYEKNKAVIQAEYFMK